MNEPNCWMIQYLDRGICRFCYPQTDKRCGVTPNECMYLLDLDGRECSHWNQYVYLANHHEELLTETEDMPEDTPEFWLEIDKLYNQNTTIKDYDSRDFVGERVVG